MPRQDCGCLRCIVEWTRTDTEVRRQIREDPLSSPAIMFIVCAICGNKRCPHATDHRHACTGSNAPGQPGSSYSEDFDDSVWIQEPLDLTFENRVGVSGLSALVASPVAAVASYTLAGVLLAGGLAIVSVSGLMMWRKRRSRRNQPADA